MEDTLRAVAQLLLFLEDAQLPDGLTVLVAVSPAVIEGRVTAPDLGAITSVGGGKFKNDADHVFVQVGAQSDLHRLYALRVVGELLGPAFGSVSEVLGARLLNGQEPFGFQDGTDGGYQRSVAQALPGEGSWLFYQRFTQDAVRFFEAKKTPLERGQVMGRPPMGNHETRSSVSATLAGNPVADSHYELMHGVRATLVRRGFACRHNGEEGLAFIGVTPDFATIPSLLNRMVGGNDRLLEYIQARQGGVFYCPPNAAWLGSVTSSNFTPVTTEPLSRAGHLMSYDTTTAFYDYLMLLKENGLFDDKDLPARISDAARPHMDDLYRALAQDPAKVEAMGQAERAAFSNAAVVNADYDQYITYG